MDHVLKSFLFRFGVVERVKLLHNKRSAALVQMQTPSMAEHAVHEQHLLNRIGAEMINVNNWIAARTRIFASAKDTMCTSFRPRRPTFRGERLAEAEAWLATLGWQARWAAILTTILEPWRPA